MYCRFFIKSLCSFVNILVTEFGIKFGLIVFNLELKYISKKHTHTCIFSVDFSLSQWKAEKMIPSMDRYSIAILEEELGLFGYLYPENQTCDKTGKFSASSGWTNSKFSRKKEINLPNSSMIFKQCL